MRGKIARLEEALDCAFVTGQHAAVLAMMLAAIDYYTARIAELTARIEVLREPYASQGSTFGPATMDQDSSHSIQTGTGPVFLGVDCPARGHRV